jgi:hypothetical protein
VVNREAVIYINFKRWTDSTAIEAYDTIRL